MTLTQTEINDLAYAALDAACYAIQTKLGVDDGLHASIYFSGDNEDLVISLLSDYIKSEMQVGQIATDDSRSNGPWGKP